jgi:hypothetical protein
VGYSSLLISGKEDSWGHSLGLWTSCLEFPVGRMIFNNFFKFDSHKTMSATSSFRRWGPTLKLGYCQQICFVLGLLKRYLPPPFLHPRPDYLLLPTITHWTWVKWWVKPKVTGFTVCLKIWCFFIFYFSFPMISGRYHGKPMEKKSRHFPPLPKKKTIMHLGVWHYKFVKIPALHSRKQNLCLRNTLGNSNEVFLLSWICILGFKDR